MMLQHFVDRRIGGVERYYLAEQEIGVIVPDEIRKCIGFIYSRHPMPEGEQAEGTVFFVSFPMETMPGLLWIYAVTAKHIIDGIKAESVDDKVLFRLNRRGGGFETLESDTGVWVTHPSDSTVDAAVAPVSFLPWVDF